MTDLMRTEPLQPTRFARQILQPALAELAPVIAIAPSDAAVRMLTAIAIQETDLSSRYQRTWTPYQPGPARGWWQFERIGVRGVMEHPATTDKAQALCRYLGVDWEMAAIHRAIEGSDQLAAGFARLLLWTDPHALPLSTQRDEAWVYYLRLWRPGKPNHERWPAAWGAAQQVARFSDD